MNLKHRPVRAALPLLAAGLFSGRAWAAPETVAADAGLLLRLIVSLALVIGLIFASAFVYRKLQSPRLSRRHSDLTVDQVLNVGNREKLLVVRMSGKKLLIGATPHSMNTLLELDSDVEEELSGREPRSPGVLSWLRQPLKASNHDQMP